MGFFDSLENIFDWLEFEFEANFGRWLSLDELWDSYSVMLDMLLRSFNQNDFPVLTIVRTEAIIKWQWRIFRRTLIDDPRIQTDCQDFLISIEATLRNFDKELKSGSLVIAVQQKDFVSARKIIQAGLIRAGVQYKNSSLAGLESFRKVLRLFGVLGV